jgi:hypothetical protein
MLLASFFVAIVQMCDEQGSTHNVPISVVRVGLPRDKLVAIEDLYWSFSLIEFKPLAD